MSSSICEVLLTRLRQHASLLLTTDLCSVCLTYAPPRDTTVRLQVHSSTPATSRSRLMRRRSRECSAPFSPTENFHPTAKRELGCAVGSDPGVDAVLPLRFTRRCA